MLLAMVARAQPATRIAALAPSLTELVFAAGAGDKLVAVSTYSDYPEAAKRLPQVTAFAGVNLESLLQYRPDLVLVWAGGTREADIVAMQKIGMRVDVIGIQQLTDVPIALRKIGVLAGTSAQAARAALAFEQRLAALRTVVVDSRFPVMIEIGRKPLMSVNRNHFISDMVARCGGLNIFADEIPLVFEPSREAILSKNPEMVIRPQSARASETELINLDDYRTTEAAKRKQVAAIHADHLLRPGPRMIEAAEAICKAMTLASAQK